MLEWLSVLLRKCSDWLHERSKKNVPGHTSETQADRARRLRVQKEMENFWNYDGTEQQPIDEVALMETSQ